MLWLEWIQTNGEAYEDLKRFLEDYRSLTMQRFLTSDKIEQIRGQVSMLDELSLVVTAQEREDQAHAERAEQDRRETAGVSSSNP